MAKGLSRGIVRLGLILSGAILLAGSALWCFLAPVAVPPSERLAAALQLLDDHQPEEARQLAQALQEEGYSDAEFAGGVEFVLGMATFQLAETNADEDTPPLHAVAVTYLQEAKHRGLLEARQPEWAFALGKSLHITGDFRGAVPHLEAAVQKHPPGRVDAALLLAELYLVPEDRTAQRLSDALALVDGALAEISADDRRYETALLLRGEVLVELGRTAEAEAVVNGLSPKPPRSPQATVLLAHVRIAEKRFDDALKLLEPLVRDDDVAGLPARRAAFLCGWAAEQRAEESAAGDATSSAAGEYRQRAEDAYQRAIDRFEHSDEGLAAAVHIGGLQLAGGAHEKALRSFGAALQTVRSTDDFHNRWMTVEEFRLRTLAAWNAWNQASRFGEAIALAGLMTPLFPRAQSEELAAKTQQRWAEAVEGELDRGTATVRLQRTPELRRLWCESGAAFARLAEARKSPSERTEALWSSIEHYFRGHDFQTALEQLNELLADPPAALAPVALVRRGEIELNLDLLDDAQRDFADVVRSNPTSPAAYTAQFLYGVCRLEMDDPQGAETAWRKILNATELTPAATEWRNALLATAKLQCDLAGLELRKTLRRESDPAEIAAAWTRVEQLATDATRMLEEYLARYPTAPDYSEAQYYLGRALQLRAEWQQRQWELAETDNGRQQARRQRDVFIGRALLQFEQLRDRLTIAAKEDRLDPTGRTLLVNVWFDYPTACFDLGRFEDAIAAYSAAANQFPHDVRVLTAYLQMAQAYSLSGQPVEARSMLEQAQVILDQRQIPDAAFAAPTTSLTRAEWDEWLDRARQVQR